MEETAKSSTSIYSTSGLLKESDVDMVSSMETEIPSDRLGETSELQGAGRAITAERVPSLLRRDFSLRGKTRVGFTFKEEDDVFPVTSTLRGFLEGPFFALEILVALGAFNKNKNIKL